jgi:plastocyanin
MRTLILAAAVAVLATAPAEAATRTVRVDDNYFGSTGSPPTVTVDKGTVVKWRWRGSRRHNVVVKSGPKIFRSKKKRTGSFERTMRYRGTYRIICEIHEPSMRMRLEVE